MQEPHRNRVTRVGGGVRSGKSRLAVASCASHVTFITTARASEDAVRRKSARRKSEGPAHLRFRGAPDFAERIVAAAKQEADCRAGAR
jgi:adenosyl cobinamide kinase/adenosyl cobinamide phosphate guanylyltransferase